MNDRSGWTSTERLLYVAGIPVLVLLGVLLFLGAASSQRKSASEASADRAAHLTPAEFAQRSREATMKEIQKEYRDCLKGMGVNFGGYRSRFSGRPDMSKVRNASSVCSMIMHDRAGGTTPAPATTPAPTPNSL